MKRTKIDANQFELEAVSYTHLKGPTMKRVKPRAQGRAYRIEKRMSHITIVLDEK